MVYMCTSWHLKIVLSIVWHLILAVFVEHGERVNLVIDSAGTRFSEHPFCTDGEILLFLFLLKNVLVSKSLWIKASAKRPVCPAVQRTSRWATRS